MAFWVNDALMFLSYNLNTKYIVMKALFDTVYLVFIVIAILGPLSSRGYSREALTILLSTTLLVMTVFPSVQNYLLYNNSSTFISMLRITEREHIMDILVSKQSLIFFITMIGFIFFGVYILMFYA